MVNIIKRISRTASIIILFLISNQSYAQNPLDSYFNGANTFTKVATAANLLSTPHDLDFVPGRPNEWWVLNKETNGASVVIFYNTGTATQTSELRRDSHNGHFMIRSTAIAIGNNGNFGSAQEAKNTSSSPTSTFMGPALWSTDTAVFARINQNNWVDNQPLGSHLDMLHQSPFGMGIAHDHDNVYWYFDGYNGNICKYDFAMPHSIGGDNHANGIIHRYTSATVTRKANLPSHMVLDKENNWLYIIDGGGNKIIRLKTTSGTVGASLPVPATANEPLAEYKEVTGATIETVASMGFTAPCGIDYKNNRLVVSDNTTGELIIYDVTNMPATEVGRINTGAAGVMGVRIANDNRIWFVNNTTKELVRIDNSNVTDIEDIRFENQAVTLYPNPAKSSFSFDIPDAELCDLKIYDITGKLVKSIKRTASKNISINNLPYGNYQVLIKAGEHVYTSKLTVQ
jgi:hypothetical protein